MSNNFEHNVKSILDDFALAPSEAVWKSIEPELPKKRKRRAIIWWLAAACVPTILGIGLALNSTSNKKDKSTAKNNVIKTQNENKEDFKPINTTEKASINPKANELSQYTDNKINTTSNQSDLQSILLKSKRNKASIIFLNKLIRDAKKSGTPKKVSLINNTYKQIATTKSIEYNEHKRYDELLWKDSLVVPIPNFLESVDTKVENVNPSFAATIRCLPQPKKSWIFQIAISGGSSVVENRTFFTNSNQIELSNINTPPTVGGGVLTTGVTPNNTIKYLPLPQNGFHIKAGLIANKPISKKFNIQTGALYTFRNNKSFATLDSVMSNNIFTEKANTIYQNQAHTLEIPFQLQTQLYNKRQINIYLITGASINWQLSNTYLQQITNTNRYLLNSQNRNTFLFTLQTGVGVKFKNVNAQIILNKGLTPIHQTGVKNYFSGIDAMVMMPLKSIIKR